MLLKNRITALAFFFFFCLCPLFSGWDGVYRWINDTGKSNGGKVRELTMKVTLSDEGCPYNIYMLYDGGEYRIFPLVGPDEDGFSAWHDYDEDSAAGEAFRVNSYRMNRTVFTPGKWKMGVIDVRDDRVESSLITTAFGMEITLEAVYAFSLDENGNKQLTFSMDADRDIARLGYFRNVARGSGGKFVLTCIE